MSFVFLQTRKEKETLIRTLNTSFALIKIRLSSASQSCPQPYCKFVLESLITSLPVIYSSPEEVQTHGIPTARISLLKATRHGLRQGIILRPWRRRYEALICPLRSHSRHSTTRIETNPSCVKETSALLRTPRHPTSSPRPSKATCTPPAAAAKATWRKTTPTGPNLPARAKT